MGGAPAATVGRAGGAGANGFTTGSSPVSRNGLNAGPRTGANGFGAGSSSSSPNGLRGRWRATGAAGTDADNQDVRTAFEP